MILARAIHFLKPFRVTFSLLYITYRQLQVKKIRESFSYNLERFAPPPYSPYSTGQDGSSISSTTQSQCSQHRGHNSSPAISCSISTPQQSEKYTSIFRMFFPFVSLILHDVSAIARKKIRGKKIFCGTIFAQAFPL